MDLNKGLKKCEYLRGYRKFISNQYGIGINEVLLSSLQHKCSTMECSGTCAYCEAQTQKLERKIKSLTNNSIITDLPELPNEFTVTPLDILEYYRNNGGFKSAKSDTLISYISKSDFEKRANNVVMGELFGIDRLSINTDGDGITTLVGLRVCPLNCKYCINSDMEGSYWVSAETLLDMVKIDSLYFEHSNGGICFGGHEPLLQIDFIIEFIDLVKSKGLNWKIGIETSLNIPDNDKLKKLLDRLDYIIVDVKSMNYDIYHNYTKRNNTMVLYNLDLLKGYSKLKKTIKVPNIPDYTTEDSVKSSIQNLLNRGFTDDEIITVDYIIHRRKTDITKMQGIVLS